jgi:quercetin dioxygenase-like cupin family protein
MLYSMRSKATWVIGAGLLGLSVLISPAQTGRAVSGTEKHKPVFVTRLYTGPDGQTHAEEIEAKFTVGSTTDAFRMLGVSGAELHRAPAGRVSDWHTAPRRQYVITLSGRGELEVAGGKKIPVEPGNIELVEDTTGKGHITRVVGQEDRVTLQLALSDQSGR